MMMATLVTKYDIGDRVWHGSTTIEKRQHECPDCLGSKAWTATSPAGSEYKVPCPRCSASYTSNDDLRLDYSIFAPRARQLTIGSVRAGTESDEYGDTVVYMCVETGIGSGSLYRESSLFLTEAEALAGAQIQADETNANQDFWVKKQYDKTVKFCDYEIKDASIKAAESKAWDASYRANEFIESVRDAHDMDDVKRAIADYEDRNQ